MLFPLLKLGIPKTARVGGSVLGVAICCAYLMGTLSLITSFSYEVISSVNMSGNCYAILYQDDILTSRIPVTNDTGHTRLLISRCFLGYPINESTYLVAINDTAHIFSSYPKIDNKSVYLGTYYKGIKVNKITIFVGNRSVNLTFDGYLSVSSFPDTWVYISENVLRNLINISDNEYSALIIKIGERKKYEKEYNVYPFHISGYFVSQSLKEINHILVILFISSGIIVSILLYTIMSVEIEYSKNDIEILRKVGASNFFIVLIFLFKSLGIIALATVLGISLGLIMPGALISIIKMIGIYSPIYPLYQWEVFLYPALTILAFGLVGALCPVVGYIKRGEVP
ncbi:MAG: hypothetical protein DRN20_00170 [Thermoplasmata archaeon]|nr:MAG: hypothetical protein DRN20_00170 [Thermoplasmata archaeon]